MTEADPHKALLASDWAPPAADLARAGRRALAVGVVFGAASAVGFVANPVQFYRSYLVAFALVLGVTLGSLAVSMLHHMSRGAWGLVIRRILEASSRTLPLVALFAVPLLFGLRHVYPWADPARVATDEILRHRAGYMNPTGVVVRLALCLAVWTFFAFALEPALEEAGRRALGRTRAPDAARRGAGARDLLSPRHRRRDRPPDVDRRALVLRDLRDLRRRGPGDRRDVVHDSRGALPRPARAVPERRSGAPRPRLGQAALSPSRCSGLTSPSPSSSSSGRATSRRRSRSTRRA